MGATKAVKRAEENIMKRGGILSPDAENRMPLFERMAVARGDTAINATVIDGGGNTRVTTLQLPDMTDEEREVLLAGHNGLLAA